MIRLEIVNQATFDAVIDLSVSASDQRLVAPNSYSLAQAWLLRNQSNLKPYAILASGQPVGFVLLDVDENKQRYFIWRLMIDQKFQNRGYGKTALKLLIEMGRQDPICQEIVIDYVFGNHRMRGMLERLGFASQKLEGNEVVMTLKLEKKESK